MNAFLECLAIGWCFGADDFLLEIQNMTGEECPTYFSKYLSICWKYITPFINLVLFVVAVARHESIKYDKYVFNTKQNCLSVVKGVLGAFKVQKRVFRVASMTY